MRTAPSTAISMSHLALALLALAPLSFGQPAESEFERAFDFTGSPLEGSESVRFDVTERETLVFETDDIIYVAEAGKARQLAELPGISALTCCGDAIFAYARSRLHLIKADGSIQPLLEVDLDSVRLAGSSRALFISGQTRRGQAVLIAKVFGQGYQHILNLPQPPDSMCVEGDRLYFTIGPVIFSVTLGGKVVQEAALLALDRVKSIAVTDGGRQILLSDGKTVFHLSRNCAPPTLRTISTAGTFDGVRVSRNHLYLGCKTSIQWTRVWSITSLHDLTERLGTILAKLRAAIEEGQDKEVEASRRKLVALRPLFDRITNALESLSIATEGADPDYDCMRALEESISEIEADLAAALGSKPPSRRSDPSESSTPQVESSLDIGLTDTEDPVPVGGTTIFLLSVRNSSNTSSTRNVRVTFDPGPGIEIVDVSAGVEWTKSGRGIAIEQFPDLRPRESRVVHIVARVNRSGELVSEARAEAANDSTATWAREQTTGYKR